MNHFVQLEALEARRLLAAVKIMPLGDSVTESFTDHAGYRFWLWKQLRLEGYDVDFVGSFNQNFDRETRQSNVAPPAYLDFDRDHEGHSEFRADDLLAGLPSYLAKNVPDVVLLHTGTNDMLQGQSVDETIGEISAIIDRLRAANPRVTVLLAQLIPAKVLNENIIALNSAIPELAGAKNTSTSRVIVVDQFSGMNITTDYEDDFHPNISGELKISGQWFASLKTILPAPNPPPQQVTWLSDLKAVSATNGLGPVEINRSPGDQFRNDGGAINLNGASTIKGLGAHANSEIVYNLAGKYSHFQSEVGIDDEVGDNGSVVFQVFIDGVKKFDSGLMTGISATKSLDIDVTKAATLKLVVTDGGDGDAFDHADWANVRLTAASNPAPAPTPTPKPTPTPDPAPAPEHLTITQSQFLYDHSPHALRFTFSGNVSASLSRDDVSVRKLANNELIPTSAIALRYDQASNSATLTFAGLKKGLLPDGRYRATILASGIQDASGRKLAGDVTFDFFFMSGDANHDGAVTRADFEILKANFAKKGMDFSHGDFNYDGKTNEADFNRLKDRWGLSVLTDESVRPSGKQMSRLIKQMNAELSEREKEQKKQRDRDGESKKQDKHKPKKGAKNGNKGGESK